MNLSRRNLLAISSLLLLSAAARARALPGDLGNVGSPDAAAFNSANLASTYEQVVAHRNLTAKVAAMAKVFPATPAGNALAMVAVLTPAGFRPYNQLEVGIVTQQLNYLNQHPADALTALQQGFAQLPSQYFAERQFLIQFAARLQLPQAQVLPVLTAELNRPAPLEADGTPGPAFFTSATALDQIVRITKDSAAAEAILLPALKAKTDPREQRALLARYRVAFPDRADTLTTQLNLRKAP